MKRKTKNMLRAVAKHLGLKVKFVGYFSANVHGKLLPREKRILINAHEPRCEHIFTLLHEIGHFLLHFKSAPRTHHPRFFDINWNAEWLTNLNSKIRRYFRFIFNRKEGKEWEANLWAFCAFIYFARQVGCHKELLAFLKRHPERTNDFLLAAGGVVYGGTKARIQKIGQMLAAPFLIAWRL